MVDLPIEGHLPDFDRATSWLNSTSLTAADIYGEQVRPLAEPRTAGPANWPGAAIHSALKPYC
jgi:hypothetical protein